MINTIGIVHASTIVVATSHIRLLLEGTLTIRLLVDSIGIVDSSTIVVTTPHVGLLLEGTLTIWLLVDSIGIVDSSTAVTTPHVGLLLKGTLTIWLLVDAVRIIDSSTIVVTATHVGLLLKGTLTIWLLVDAVRIIDATAVAIASGTHGGLFVQIGRLHNDLARCGTHEIGDTVDKLGKAALTGGWLLRGTKGCHHGQHTRRLSLAQSRFQHFRYHHASFCHGLLRLLFIVARFGGGGPHLDRTTPGAARASVGKQSSREAPNRNHGHGRPQDSLE